MNIERIQRVVDELQQVLAAESDWFARESEAAECVAAYAEQCRAANVRLRECDALLNRHLRAEAIQLSEQEPELLDTVAVLDTVDRERLAGLCATILSPVPDEPLIQLASRLNESYSAHTPLAALLKSQRLAAIAHDPIEKRTAILRQIAALDVENPIWLEDLQVFEAACATELLKRAGEAAKQGSLDEINRIHDALCNEPWQNRPDPKIVQYVLRTRHELFTTATREALQALAPQLNAAHAELDFDSASELAEAWRGHAEGVGLADHDELARQAAPALLWVEEQQLLVEQARESEQAAQRLEAALYEHNQPELLWKLYQRATRHGHELSAQLERQFRRRIASLQQQAAIRRRTTWAIASVCALTLAGFAIYGIVTIQRYRESGRHAVAIAGLLNEKREAEARQYVERLKNDAPAVLSFASVQTLLPQLEKLESEEADRLGRWKSLVQTSKAAREKAELDDALSNAKQALNIARSTDEQAETKKWMQRIESEIVQRRAEAEAKFLETFTKQADKAKLIPLLTSYNSDAVLTKSTELRNEVQSILRADLFSGPQLRGQAETLLARLSKIISEAQANKTEEEAFALVLSLPPATESHKQAIASFIQANPKSIRAPSLKAILGEAVVWKGIEEWNELATAYNERRTKWNAGERSDWLTRAKAWQQDHGAPEFAAALSDCINVEDVVAKRADESKTALLGELQPFYSDENPILNAAYLVKNGDKEQFYTIEEPITKNGIVYCKQVLNFNGFTKSRPLPESAEKKVVWSLAPHCEAIRASEDLMSENFRGVWEAEFAKVIDRCLESKSMDKVIRFIIIKRFLSVGCGSSHWLQKELGQTAAVLENADVDTSVNWLVQDDDGSELNRTIDQARNSADNEIGAIQFGLQSGLDKAVRAALSHQKIELSKVTAVGVLRRKDGGEWYCKFANAKSVKPGAQLCVLSTKAGTPELHPVGAANKKALSAAEIGNALGVVGEPVFVLEGNSTK